MGFLSGAWSCVAMIESAAPKAWVADDAAEMQRRSGTQFPRRQIRFDLGSALEYPIRLTFFVKGRPNFRLDVMDEFFAEHCPNRAAPHRAPS